MKELKRRLLIGVMVIFHCCPQVLTSNKFDESQSQRHEKRTNDGSSLSGRSVWIQKAKPQPNYTLLVPLLEIGKKRTIIIKYHHFVTFKGIWKYFPPILLLVFVCQCLLSLFFFLDTVETVEQIRVE